MKHPAVLRFWSCYRCAGAPAGAVGAWLMLAVMALVLGASPTAHANHLVGSDWRMLALGNEQFRVRLTVYIDPVGGGGGAPTDRSATVAAYARGSAGNPDRLVTTYVLPQTGRRPLPGAGAACSAFNVPVEELVYEAVLTLPASQFGNATGHYLAWERCCRNQILTNIVNGENEGLVAVLAFPGLYTPGGAAFRNSAPQFGAAPRAVALCRGEAAQVSFAATDADADSLAYALVPALAGYTTPLTPFATLANPAPYPPVRYAGSYSATQPFGGAFQLNPRTGELRGTGAQPGTYAVVVAVREYRQGVLLGENRRDIELSVTECPANALPRLTRLTPPAPPDTVRITGAADRCLTLSAFDPDAGQILRVRAVGDAPVTISPAMVTVPFPPAPVLFTVCWTDCARPTRQTLTLVVEDDGCRTLVPDTLRIPVQVVPAARTPLVLTQTPPLPDTLTVAAGQALQLTVTAHHAATGASADSLTLQLLPGNAPGLLPATVRGRDTVRLVVAWVPPCPAARAAPYALWFRATTGSCNPAVDSLRVLVQVLGNATATALPNIITPNADGLNDCFGLANPATGACADAFAEVRIFSRWGQLVYRSTDAAFCWTAPHLAGGTYYYFVRRAQGSVRGWVEVVR